MGKVKSAIVCTQGADGRWQPHRDSPLLAVKQVYKWCIHQGTTLDGRHVREDPRLEMSIMHRLSVPGHRNVLRLIALLEDEECYYMVLEFLDGGELFEQVWLTRTGGKGLSGPMPQLAYP
jgi:serine/threonine protein kinase